MNWDFTYYVRNRKRDSLTLYSPFREYFKYLLLKVITIYVIFLTALVLIGDRYCKHTWEQALATFIFTIIMELILPNALIRSYIYLNQKGIYLNKQGDRFFRGFVKNKAPDYSYDEIVKWTITRVPDHYKLIIYEANNDTISSTLFGDSQHIEKIRRYVSEMIPIPGD